MLFPPFGAVRPTLFVVVRTRTAKRFLCPHGYTTNNPAPLCPMFPISSLSHRVSLPIDRPNGSIIEGKSSAVDSQEGKRYALIDGSLQTGGDGILDSGVN